ncbi:MAG: hypothetical protein L3J39_03405 [Verrucomicrobiales bacterium]|nr:hypothetical protein [Verrucomicrobiales bacterium]
MKLKTLLITAIGAFALNGANAGESAPAVDAKNVVVEEAESTFSGEISAGYDTRYIFRGLWFGDNAVWGNVSIAKEITSKLTWSSNVFYTDIMDNDLAYSEYNLGTALSYESEVGTFGIGLTYFRFLDGFSGNNGTGPGGQKDTTELYVSYSRELFYGITGSLLAAYDFRIDAQYLEAGLGKTWKFNDVLSLDAAAAVGYGLNDYYSQALSGDDANAFTHVLVSVGLPIKITETAVLRPHVSANFSGDARSRGNAGSIGDEEVFYGVSFAVSF